MKFRESKYNIAFQNKGSTYIYNTLNNVLAKIENEIIDIYEKIRRFENISDEEAEQVNSLLENGFISGSTGIKGREFDEWSLLKERNNIGKYASDTLSLTILPSLNCNYKCIYCYQSPEKSVMNDATKTEIIDFVLKCADRIRRLNVTWFGGEPLLYFEIVKELSVRMIYICEKKHINYAASIITNGSLINENMAGHMKKLKINEAQITIDGVGKVNNDRRVCKNKKTDSFKKSVNAVNILQNAGIDAIVRVNIDKRNEKNIEALIDYFELNEMTDVLFSFARVEGFTKACEDKCGCYLSDSEFSFVENRLNTYCINKQIFSSPDIYFPELLRNYCGADQIGSFTIGPKGELYKCWCDIGDESRSIGNIKSFEPEHDLKGIEHEYISSANNKMMKCKSCKLAPLCMGGCPRNKKKNIDCSYKQEVLVEQLRNYLLAVEKEEAANLL